MPQLTKANRSRSVLSARPLNGGRAEQVIREPRDSRRPEKFTVVLRKYNSKLGNSFGKLFKCDSNAFVPQFYNDAHVKSSRALGIKTK